MIVCKLGENAWYVEASTWEVMFDQLSGEPTSWDANPKESWNGTDVTTPNTKLNFPIG
jgi:hypothetical protein